MMNDAKECLDRFAQKRDAEAFRVLVEEYQRLVYSAASRRLGNSHDIEDVVQSTFLKLAKAAGTIRSDLASWLYSTTINTANDLIRRDQSRRRREEISASPESVSEDVERAEWNKLSLIIDQVLVEMPEPERSVLVEHFLSGRSQRDLAREMKVSQPTVMRRINAAVEELRERLARLGYTTAAPVLLSMLEKIPQATVPVHVTAELAKIGVSGAPSAPVLARGKFSGPVMMKIGLIAVVLVGLPIAIFFLFTTPTPNPTSAPTATISQSLRGRVLAPDGSPAGGVTVFTAYPGPSATRIRNGIADVIDPHFPQTVTDAKGEFTLPPQQGKFALVAIAETGIAQADQDAVATNADIRLLAWGRLQGRLMLGTKPGVGVDLQASEVDPLAANDRPVPVSIVSRARTDADGRFTMERLLPGLTLIQRDVPETSGSNSTTFFDPAGAAQIVAGQTSTATIGGVGRPVVGKFVFPEGMNPDDFLINAHANGRSKSSPTPRDLLLRNNHLLEVDSERHFRIENVPPGDFRIHIFLERADRTRTAQPDEPRFNMPPIPGGVSDEPLVIPDIQLR